MDRDTILREIKRVARKKGVERLSRSQFEAETGISDDHIYKHFEGWREACEAAGLKPHIQNIRLKDDELFEEMHRVFVALGGICTRMKFERTAKFGSDVYSKRFGGWPNTLLKFKQWLEDKKVNFPFVNQLPAATKTDVPPRSEISLPLQRNLTEWKSVGGGVYGPFLNFRGLQHAPVNEQGVVFLFGMVCVELGFVVEAIRTDFPDCDAKRRVDKTRDKWERVKIEFEYRSSTFKEHGHNPKDCDVIVCWEHDWPDCPLEVVELKTAIQTLKE